MKDILYQKTTETINIAQWLKQVAQHKNIRIDMVNEGGKGILNLFLTEQYMKDAFLFILPSSVKAKQAVRSLKPYFGDRIYYLPAEPVHYHFTESHSKDLTYQRLEIMGKIRNSNNIIIVTTIEALQKKWMPSNIFDSLIRTIRIEDIIEPEKFEKELIYLGYERVYQVEAKGQFSRRGGIVDFYNVLSEYPVRLEFFGDEIDSLRFFDHRTQLSVNSAEEALLYPAKEIVLKEEERQNLYIEFQEKYSADENFSSLLEEMGENLYEYDELLFTLKKKYENITGYFRNYILMTDEPETIRQMYENYYVKVMENYGALSSQNKVFPESMNSFVELTTEEAEKNAVKTIEYFQGFSDGHISPPAKFISTEDFKKHPWDYFRDVITKKTKEGYFINIRCISKEDKETLIRYFGDLDLTGLIRKKADKPGVVFSINQVSEGFEIPEHKILCINQDEILSLKHKPVKKHKKKKTLDSFTELKVGDYVVHDIHGIGKYLGTETVTIEKVRKDFAKIQYAGSDRLFVPIDQMDSIQTYIGTGETPRVSKMGGGEWKKAKSRAKKAAEDMADELVSLYAKRQSMKGFAYPADTVWQKDFENNFEYIETEEQLRAAEEIKEDMEKESPMDRLVCGDVGYGKTEVALRSAFKAIDNSKQVAILVPTTVLAQQHYNAIVKRFEGFPIKVEMLSRFRTQAQQRKILKDLKYGQVDIVVGTHKLLSDKIKYYDLGLLIIDEEQRFGVRHKEKIKQMKNEIDVLTLTATPIPRTLHMSMVGVKDISLIEEPPPGRIPVQTYVLEYNPYIIKEAIEKEISRGGQVFYVHNKVMGIEKLKDQITSMIPGARVVIAHGQMPERQLEKVMVSFLEHEYDVLIATTIIESGLDVANANTMIIDHADQFGLSQLHQLRGRVGRSSKQAYVYMTYQKNKILSEIASKRLKAVKEFTEFGAGFKIAMKDLEIRGAGNLLSSAQHGHLSDVGYELFCRMIEEAIKEKKGEPVVHREQINLKMNVNAYIPEKYISEEKSRYEVYRKIAMITDEKECQQLTEELIDRYGDIPVPVIRLMDMGFIKNLGQKTGIIKLVQKEKMISLFFSKRVSLDLMTSQDVFKRHSVKLNVKNTQNIQLDIPIRYNKEQDMVKKIIKILSDLGKNPIGQFTEEYKEENNV